MKYYIKQKWFSWGDVFHIYDAAGNECFSVEGEVLTFGKRLHLYDMNGQELVYIEQEMLTFLPCYHISVGGSETARVVKEFTFFSREYTVEGPGWKVTGDFFDYEYEIADGSRTVAAISKEWFTLGDAYEIDIQNDADALTALAVVLVIDACLDRK